MVLDFYAMVSLSNIKVISKDKTIYETNLIFEKNAAGHSKLSV